MDWNPDALFEEPDYDLEYDLERYRRWVESWELGPRTRVELHRTCEPPWVRDGVEFGWHSDGQWAVTVRPDPRYL